MQVSREELKMHGSEALGKVEVVLNGQRLTAEARSLADLVACQGLQGKKVATALNGYFVPELQRATTPLNPGDRVEIVSPRQGG
jgi:sulfur carrier protein